MRFETKTLNRWSVVVGATSIQLALGAIYAWSVFTARLTDIERRTYGPHPHVVSAGEGCVWTVPLPRSH